VGVRKFAFRLEPVLEMRRRAEEERQRVVALLERERLEVEEKLRAVQRSIEAARQEQREMLSAGGPVAVHGVRLQAGAAMAAMGRAHHLALELAGVMKRLESARGELLRAAAARKAVELLRERQLEQWRQEMGRREIADLDDIAAGLRLLAAREEAERP